MGRIAHVSRMCGVFLSAVRAFPSWDRPAACAGPSRKCAFLRAAGSANSASELSLEAGSPGRGRGGSECCAHVQYTQSTGSWEALRAENHPPPATRGCPRCRPVRAGLRFRDRRVFRPSAQHLVLSADGGPGRGHPPEPSEPSAPVPASAKGAWPRVSMSPRWETAATRFSWVFSQEEEGGRAAHRPRAST